MPNLQNERGITSSSDNLMKILSSTEKYLKYDKLEKDTSDKRVKQGQMLIGTVL